LRLLTDLAFPADDIPLKLEASLSGTEAFSLMSAGPFAVEELPEAPEDATLRRTLVPEGGAGEAEGRPVGWVFRRLALELSPADPSVGTLALSGEVLHGEYGTSLDTLPPMALQVLPPRLIADDLSVEEGGGDEGGGLTVKGTLSTSTSAKVKGDLSVSLVPSGAVGRPGGEAGGRSQVADAPVSGRPPGTADQQTLKVTIKDTLDLEWEVGREELGVGVGAMDAVLTLSTRKYGVLRVVVPDVLEMRRDVDYRTGAPAPDVPSPSPGDRVTITAPVVNKGKTAMEITPVLRLHARPASEGRDDNGQEPGGDTAASRRPLGELEGEIVTVMAGELEGEGESVKARWVWNVPADLPGITGDPTPMDIIASVILRYTDREGGAGEQSGPEARMFTISPGIVPAITSVVSGRERAVPGEGFPVRVTVVNQGGDDMAEAVIGLRAWLLPGRDGGSGDGAVPDTAPFTRLEKKARLERRPLTLDFNIPVPERRPDEGRGGSAGPPRRLAVETTISAGEAGARTRFFPSFATLLGKSVMELEVVRLPHGSRSRPSGGGRTPDGIHRFLFADEKVLESVTDGRLTHHLLNSNTFIYEYGGRVVDSLEWRERGLPLLPFYRSLFLNVLHTGKFSSQRLDAMAQSMEVRGTLIAGLCHRMLFPGRDVLPVGSVAFTGEKEALASRRTFSPGRWREWALGTAAKGSGEKEESKVSVRPFVRALGLKEADLSSGAPALAFSLEALAAGIGGGKRGADRSRAGKKAGPGVGAGRRGGSGTTAKAASGAAGAPAAHLEEMEALFTAARKGVRGARLKPLNRLWRGLSSFTGEDTPTPEGGSTPMEDLTRKVRLDGAAAVRAAGLATCVKAGFMAASSQSLGRLRRVTDEPFTDFLGVLRAEFYVHVLDAITERLLGAGEEYRKDLTPHLLMCGASAFPALRRDSRLIFGEFLRRARRYITNMRVRNTMAAVRGAVDVRPEDGYLEYAPGSEVGTSIEIANPTSERMSLTAILALPERGISIVEPESAYSEGLHFLPPVDVPAGGTRVTRLTFFIPEGEDMGDSRAAVALVPASRELLAELGGGRTLADGDG